MHTGTYTETHKITTTQTNQAHKVEKVIFKYHIISKSQGVNLLFLITYNFRGWTRRAIRFNI